MAEARAAKWIAIALGVIEFLFGIAMAVAILIQQSWISANPTVVTPVWWWPMIWVFALAVTIAPPTIAYIAERSSSRRVVYTCVAVLIAYPLSLLGLANVG